MINKDYTHMGLIYENMKPAKSIEEIMKKHNVSREEVQSNLDAGTKIEMEHVTDKDTATTIASQHLFEKIDYYKLLKKVEKAS